MNNNNNTGRNGNANMHGYHNGGNTGNRQRSADADNRANAQRYGNNRPVTDNRINQQRRLDQNSVYYPQRPQPRPQTVRERRESGNTPYIDPETNEFRRRSYDNRRYKKNNKGEFGKLVTGWLTLFLIAFAVMAAIVAAVFFINLNSASPEAQRSYKYKYGDDAATTVDYAAAMSDGVLYVSMTKLAEMLGMTTTGDSATLKYILTDGVSDGEWASFSIGNRAASVNGQSVRASGNSRLIGEQLWIPADFITAYMNGVTLTVDEKQNAVTLARVMTNDDKNAPEYEAVSFKLKTASVIEKISESDFAEPAIEFATDLSAYEEYMNPADRNAYLTLVNTTHTLDADYIPDDLTDVADTRSDRSARQMRLCAEKALEAFFIEMRANNINLVSVTSAYRGYAEQEGLFTQRLAYYPNLSEAEAYATAAAVVAPPGTSEHQTGLACDMHNLSSADVSFAETGAYEWMSQNAHKFGFIVRYPEDKVDITGISFEPWHYRYVGRYHATKMYESGMCLEEYVASLGLD